MKKGILDYFFKFYDKTSKEFLKKWKINLREVENNVELRLLVLQTHSKITKAKGLMENIGIWNIEKAVLGTILASPQHFEDMASVLEEKDFSDPFFQLVYSGMQKLNQLEKPIDAFLLMEEIKTSKSYNEEEYLSLASRVELVAFDSYIQQIKNHAIKRNLHKMATEIVKDSNDSTKSAEEILENIEKQVYALSMEGEQGGFRESKDIVFDTIEMIKQLKERGNNVLTGLNTGFAELNRVTTGFNPGELIIIGARPSMGKTTFVLNMVQKFLTCGSGVAFFSLEMQAEHLMLRMLSAMSDIPLQLLKVGNLDDLQWESLQQSASHMQTLPLFVDDGSYVNITQFRSKLRRLKSKNPDLGVAVVDYLQLMSGSKKGAGESKRQEEISEISRSLKILARELQIPIIALSQLNRMLESREDKRPQLSDLRESGAIEQDADMIMFLYREDVYKEREERERKAKYIKENNGSDQGYQAKHQSSEVEKAEVIVAKNRNGETKTIKIQFNKKFTRFEDRAEGEEKEYNATRWDNAPVEDMSVFLSDMPTNL